MATYVIGDLQGCYEPLQRLLKHINYIPGQDMLWFCGDLIARGPDSLACLQFVYNLGNRARTVLGNHDLNFIASYYGFGKIQTSDKLQALQQSPQLPELIDWLCQQPLIHLSHNRQQLMVHAGLAPEWDIQTAQEAAAEVSNILQTDPVSVLKTMYDNKPERWRDAVTAEQRWRFTINACTRMRFCHYDGALELKEKGSPQATKNLIPWYEFWRDKPRPELFFGHWASLNGYSPVSGIHALDTGCVWGNELTAYCIETQQRYTVTGLQ
ncbi:symmetrical bis(5'-nucleosyl)-tetraphosphatase [Chromatiaceae bacterium AAb-1]|nr:symmetrical bis(5'-nucleosyl)-tetraphosphatase [Chromatiaceae bacterium AAb-1]